ncbi:hypothetical protein N7539_000013 [Penicillium diatomitis]|uniref:RNase H type-1 domain-containing protein n=1 Tax=Penicillium diatomitis TaxID=2819901 RepID=A0A9W9XKW5_9EURO|nr:uncharacterized protein N7539_000013 [Penicillium diatomitis]KAJ5494897.1 hypothetical protein N7539_000013 [Penicillium diatomitis]
MADQKCPRSSASATPPEHTASASRHHDRKPPRDEYRILTKDALKNIEDYELPLDQDAEDSQPVRKLRSNSDLDRPQVKVFIRTREKALIFAMEAQSWNLKPVNKNARIHVFWTDASVVNACAAGAVARQEARPGEFVTTTYTYPCPVLCPLTVEIFAIANALSEAATRVRECLRVPAADGSGRLPQHEVFVFTDSEGALRVIRGTNKKALSQDTQVLVQFVTSMSVELKALGSLVELHLVPGHSKVPGNCEAHTASRYAARSLASQRGMTNAEEGMRLYQKGPFTALFPLPEEPSFLLDLMRALHLTKPVYPGQALGIGFLPIFED